MQLSVCAMLWHQLVTFMRHKTMPYKKAELTFPRSKKEGRGLNRQLSPLVVYLRLAVNLSCLLYSSFLCLYTGKQMLPTPRPHASAMLPQQNPQVGYTNRAADTLLPASGCSELVIGHYLSRTLLWPPWQGIRPARSMHFAFPMQ